MACSLSYCIFPNALVMQLYVIPSVTNIDFTSKTNNSWYKSPITAWKIPFERYDSYLSPNVKKQTHYPFFHVYFNGFLPPFNFLFHPWRVASTDNILCKNAEIANFYWLRTIFDTDLQYWPIKSVVTFSEPFFGLRGWPQ